MYDKWLDNLREQLSQPRAEAPDGLWDDIERSLPAQRKGFFSAPVRLSAACGLAAAIAIGAGFLFLADRGEQEGAQQDLTGVQSVVKVTSVAELKATEELAMAEHVAVPPVISPSETIEEEETAKESAPAEPVKNETVVESQADEQPRMSEAVYSDYEELDLPTGGQKKSRFSLSLYADNVLAGNASDASSASRQSAALAGSHRSDSIMLRSPLRRPTEDSPVVLKHHLPVKFGVRLRYRLSETFSIESGITYSMLKAEGSGMYLGRELHTSQRLHYLGIPVNAILSMWHNRRFDIYASAGAAVEKCISGRIENRLYEAEGEAPETERKSCTVRPLQFSVNASAGVQMSLADNMGIYVEPGLGYYFKNGSKVETYYSENPFSFSLQAGFRFSF